MIRVNISISPEALLPVRQTKGSVGYDLHASESRVIEPQERSLIYTGVKISIPLGMYGRISPRSSWSYKFSIDVGAGVIDNDYRGELKVVLINNGKNPFQVNKGDRIAQLIFENCTTPRLEVVSDLEETVRGVGGFGSTNKN